MNHKLFLALWGVLFIICAVLGFMPEGDAPVAALAFFLPPAFLLYRAGKMGDRACVKLVCALAALSLVLTLGLLIGNVLSVGASEWVGTMLYYLLVIVSAPMVCSGYWALSLFLWASLLVAGVGILQKKP